jgi:hypothetical protein
MQKGLVVIRERHWPTPSGVSHSLALGTPDLARRLAREKERHSDIGQDRVQGVIALACAGIGNMMEPRSHGESDTLCGEVL